MSKSKKLARRIEDLQGDERDIVSIVLDRIEQGRKTYGPWRVDDRHSNPREALYGVIDALHYSAAELYRLSKCACCGRHHIEEICA